MITKTLDYSLHIVSRYDKTSWALCADVDGLTATPVLSGVLEGTASAAERGEILTRMIDYLVTSDLVIAGGEVDVFIFDTAARQTLIDLGAQFGPIRALTRSQMKYREGWDRYGWRHCLDLLGGIDEVTRTDLSARPFIEAATDGSYSRGTLASGASCAWIREDGQFDMVVLDHGGILEAELFGIRRLLGAAAPGERLRIYVDSKDAIRCVERIAGEERDRHSNQAEDIVRTIRELMETRVDAQLVWVKGHEGHALNDGADRLAVLARRTKNTVTYNTRSTVARNIVEDALENHRSSQLAHAS